MLRILVVDDDQYIRELLELNLSKAGFSVVQAADGNDALVAFEKHQPDLILLDIMLPGKPGWQVCQDIRAKSNIPIIMISAKGEEVDKVTGLDLGADDYISKPFSPREVIARINAVLRRSGDTDSNEQEDLSRGNLYINMTQWIVRVGDQNISLTPKETELLWHLARHTNHVLSREQLLGSVWGYEYYGDARTVDVHIKRLREKLGVVPAEGWQIKTIWSVGYKFEVEAHETTTT